MKTITILFGVFLAFSAVQAQNQIHWTSTDTPLKGLTITWQSSSPSDSIRWGYTTACEKGSLPGVRRSNYSGYLYDHTFPSVKSSSVIHYSIKTGTSWSMDKTFNTASKGNSTHIKFLAGGDSRTKMDKWAKISSRMAREKVDFNLFLGDHVKSGSNGSDWDEWYTHGKNLLQNQLLYHTGGNHEYGPNYLNQFTLPGNEKWYSFTHGDAKFICLLTETNFKAQHEWLLNELQQNTKKWVFVFFHKPFFTTGKHSDQMNPYRSTWWKAFDDYGVDVVLGGHTHNYQRSKPMNLNVSNDAPVAQYGDNPSDGRLNVVLGSLGAPLSKAEDAWFNTKAAKEFHYAKFDLNGDRLRMEVFNIGGNLIDAVTIIKPHPRTPVRPMLAEPAPSKPDRTTRARASYNCLTQSGF